MCYLSSQSLDMRRFLSRGALKKKKTTESILLLQSKAADCLGQNGANNIAAQHYHPTDKSKGLKDDVFGFACGWKSSDQLEMVFFSWRAFDSKVTL